MYKFLRNNCEALYDPETQVVQEVPWNFAKFIIDGSTGQVVSYYNPRISPLSLRQEIEAMLTKGAPYEAKDLPEGLGGFAPLPKDLSGADKSGCATSAVPSGKTTSESAVQRSS